MAAGCQVSGRGPRAGPLGELRLAFGGLIVWHRELGPGIFDSDQRLAAGDRLIFGGFRVTLGEVRAVVSGILAGGQNHFPRALPMAATLVDPSIDARGEMAGNVIQC